MKHIKVKVDFTLPGELNKLAISKEQFLKMVNETLKKEYSSIPKIECRIDSYEGFEFAEDDTNSSL